MRVLAYSGSMRGHTSKTYQIIKQMTDELKEKHMGHVEVDILCANNLKLEICRGCMNCFESKCSIVDDLSVVLNKVKSADVVILGSPVYVHQVTAPTKNLIDRLGTLCYLFQLLGKLGITLSVSNTNGNKPVNAYLYKILDTWGADVVANVAIQQYVQTEEQINNAISVAVNRVLEAYTKRERNCSENQKRLFNLYKNVFYNSKDSELKKYWIENQYFKFDDVEAMLHQKMQELDVL